MLNFGGSQFTNIGFPGVGMIGLWWIIQLVVQILLSTWAYRDARRRGNSKEFAIIAMVGVLVVPIAGAIVYYLIREDNDRKSSDNTYNE